MTITDIFVKHNTDKDHPQGHSYGPVYAQLLEPIRDRVKSVLEIGILGGSSLRSWKEYFPQAEIVGLDINKASLFTEPRITTFHCDATNKDSLDAVLGNRMFDLIVDDGSHWGDHQIASWKILKDRLSPGGVYVVEDVQHDSTAHELAKLGAEIFDLRGNKARFDDILAVFHSPQGV